MLQMFGSMGLINDLNFSFTDRFDGAADYFTSTNRVRKRWDKTNFVKDIRKSEVVDWPERGEGNAGTRHTRHRHHLPKCGIPV